jgi:hypothetical protein
MCAFVSPHTAPQVLARATDGMDARWHAGKLNLEGDAMIGTMLTFHPHQSQPVVAQLTAPPSLKTVEGILGGPISISGVGYLSNIEHQGKVHACVAFRNEEGGYGLEVAFGSEVGYHNHYGVDRYVDEFRAHCGLDINRTATILLRKEWRDSSGPCDMGYPDATLFGRVVVLFGDPDFMQAMVEGSAMQKAQEKHLKVVAAYEAEERRRAEEDQERARIEERPKANWKKRVLTAVGCGAVLAHSLLLTISSVFQKRAAAARPYHRLCQTLVFWTTQLVTHVTLLFLPTGRPVCSGTASRFVIQKSLSRAR